MKDCEKKKVGEIRESMWNKEKVGEIKINRWKRESRWNKRK